MYRSLCKLTATGNEKNNLLQLIGIILSSNLLKKLKIIRICFVYVVF